MGLFFYGQAFGRTDRGYRPVVLGRSPTCDPGGCVYLLLFWLLLMLAYTGIRYGRALAALAQCPLVINTFDNFICSHSGDSACWSAFGW